MKYEITPTLNELEFTQREVLKLRKVASKDREYEMAQRAIKRLTSQPDFKEPELIMVQNISGHVVNADDTKIEKGATGQIYPWQLRALARFFEQIA